MGGRRTYVLHVYGGGACVVTEVRTGRSAALDCVAQVDEQIRRWAADDPSADEIR